MAFIFMIFAKKGKLTGLTKQDKKGDFAVLTRTCRAECYLHHPGAMPRITGFIFCISAVPTPAVRAACPCAPSFFNYFPRPRCCGLIASLPGQCASSGGRLPEALFMVFQLDSKGAEVCKSSVLFSKRRISANLEDLVKSFQTSTRCFIYLQIWRR